MVAFSELDFIDSWCNDMKKRHFTIGMAGHIDHGKTELVKALTNIDTDRLKEEKERRISIELGYAPLFETDDLDVSIIDVPGHEKFIRQMIAGVTSIDLTILAIAADEGVMPQTLEHLDILNHLKVSNGIIVMTKITKADEELRNIVREDILEATKGTVFEGEPIFEVDSMTLNGIDPLKQNLLERLAKIEPKSHRGSLFLPVDQSFHLHGIGTIVRGTIANGSIDVDRPVYLMPEGKKVQIKSIHHFNHSVQSAFAGQRAAIALNNVELDEVKRGTVLTDYKWAKASDRIDIELNVSSLLQSTIKQRSPIKLHTGTSEVYGRIIFFDRHKLEPNSEIMYVQLQLDQSIYVMKDQRFILRRATPVELIGGGKIIDPFAEKHSHTQETIDVLKEKASFSPEEYALSLIEQQPGSTLNDLGELVTKENLHQLIHQKQVIKLENLLFTKQYIESIESSLVQILKTFHEQHPLLLGEDKSEIMSKLSLKTGEGKLLFDYFINQGLIKQNQHFISLNTFEVNLSSDQQRKLNSILDELKRDDLKVESIHHYLSHQKINDIDEWIKFLIQHNYIVSLTDELFVERNVFEDAIKRLRVETGDEFEVKEAKGVLELSRKYIIPFLEKLDKLQYTRRFENIRKWLVN
ncbi:selenocysteine-specific elongation factor [Piscibacillus halophilus]|uniref:Selenocysteine-specific elongation factor n=2 Tax=Piscibacillus halophilus TaxID=571933 RepID=A0A1H8Z8P4_9BACI|nr:selenocysteine-specific elongation factor [Piscibacillus halophilus]